MVSRARGIEVGGRDWGERKTLCWIRTCWKVRVHGERHGERTVLHDGALHLLNRGNGERGRCFRLVVFVALVRVARFARFLALRPVLLRRTRRVFGGRIHVAVRAKRMKVSELSVGAARGDGSFDLLCARSKLVRLTSAVGIVIASRHDPRSCHPVERGGLLSPSATHGETAEQTRAATGSVHRAELHVRAGLDASRAFEALGRRERPARSARGLIAHGRDHRAVRKRGSRVEIVGDRRFHLEIGIDFRDVTVCVSIVQSVRIVVRVPRAEQDLYVAHGFESRRFLEFPRHVLSAFLAQFAKNRIEVVRSGCRNQCSADKESGQFRHFFLRSWVQLVRSMDGLDVSFYEKSVDNG